MSPLILLYFLSYFQPLSFCSTLRDFFNFILSRELFISAIIMLFFALVCSFLNSIFFLFHGCNSFSIPYENINNNSVFCLFCFLISISYHSHCFFKVAFFFFCLVVLMSLFTLDAFFKCLGILAYLLLFKKLIGL